MNKISKLFKTQSNSTQAHKPEKASSATIFSRGEDSGSKLLLSLKNLFFSRTDKSSAKAVVTQAVSADMTEPIKSEAKTLAKPGLDLRGRVRQVYRQLPDRTETMVSHFDSAIHKLIYGKKLRDDDSKQTLKELVDIKTSVEQNKKMNDSSKNQLLNDIDLLIKLAANDKEKIDTGRSPQFKMVESFMKDFDSNLNSMIEKIPGMNEQSSNVKIFRAAIIGTAKTELALQINDDSNNAVSSTKCNTV